MNDGHGPADTGEPAEGLGTDGFGSDDGFGTDELALRRLLRQSVREIEPNDHALERLQRAVPARRARKRQAVVGVAAAALFIGTAVPALVHVTNSRGGDDHPSIAGAGSSERTHDGSNQGKGEAGTGDKNSGGHSGSSTSKDKKDKKDKGKGDKGKEGGGTGGATGGPDPQNSEAATSPACEAAQLAGAAPDVGTADANGTVYGTFRISNTSGNTCTVEAAGTVTATAQGAADPTKVTVVDHTAGDAAAGLPDPALETTSLVLKPGAAYEVKFAWVPAKECPSEGGDPSPDPTPSEGGGGTDGGSSAPDGVQTQLVREDGGTPADGSVAVNLTAEAGSPAVGATVPNACAGTVYKTGVLPGQ
ncbi:hypothetical protein ACQB60_44715 [Actinomycetota bacterium Odt1-20B]